MKKIVCLLLVILLCAMVSIPVTADTTRVSSQGDPMTIIKAQTSEETVVYLSQKDLYKQEELAAEAAHRPILPVYRYPSYRLYDKSIDEILTALDEYEKQKPTYVDYLLLGDAPDWYPLEICTCLNLSGDLWLDSRQHDSRTVPIWLSEFMNEKVIAPITQQGLVVNKILCLEYQLPGYGVTVFYLLENGSFYVKFYEAYNDIYSGKTLTLSEEEFRKYSKGYCDLITSYEHNYDEDGNLLIGGSISFVDYVAETTLDNLEMVAETPPATGEPRPVWLFMTVGAAVLAAAILAAVLILKARKG